MYIGVGGIYVPRYVGNSCTQVWGVFMYPGMGGFMFPGMGIQVHRYGGIHVPRFGVIHVPRYSGWGGFHQRKIIIFSFV